MAKRLLVVTIESLTVFVNGDVPGQGEPTGEQKRNAVIASLKYPRSGTPSVTSGQQFNLSNNVPLKPDMTDFFKCGIFKEEVQDETILQIKLTDTDKASGAEKFFAALLGALMGGGLGAAAAGLGSFFGAVAGFGADQVKTGLAGLGKDQVFVIGQTDEVRLAMEKLPADKNDPLRMDLPLIVPEEVRKPYFELNPQGGAVRKELVLAKGFSNGNIVLRLAALPIT
jgi:hypothetical protein